jgi:hypothetical protein
MPQRIQLRRTKGWRKPEGAIVVSRPSKWGNPWTMQDFNELYGVFDKSTLRRLCAEKFEDQLEPCLLSDNGIELGDYADIYEMIRAELGGHDLACWCPLDQPCHADVLLELANDT